MRKAHEIADEHEDVATASLLENWIDEAEKRTWFLFEAGRAAERSGPLSSIRTSGSSRQRALSCGARSAFVAARRIC